MESIVVAGKVYSKYPVNSTMSKVCLTNYSDSKRSETSAFAANFRTKASEDENFLGAFVLLTRAFQGMIHLLLPLGCKRFGIYYEYNFIINSIGIGDYINKVCISYKLH